jgi:hypothetical protein
MRIDKQRRMAFSLIMMELIRSERSGHPAGLLVRAWLGKAM